MNCVKFASRLQFISHGWDKIERKACSCRAWIKLTMLSKTWHAIGEEVLLSRWSRWLERVKANDRSSCLTLPGKNTRKNYNCVKKVISLVQDMEHKLRASLSNAVIKCTLHSRRLDLSEEWDFQEMFISIGGDFLSLVPFLDSLAWHSFWSIKKFIAI